MTQTGLWLRFVGQVLQLIQLKGVETNSTTSNLLHQIAHAEMITRQLPLTDQVSGLAPQVYPYLQHLLSPF